MAVALTATAAFALQAVPSLGRSTRTRPAVTGQAEPLLGETPTLTSPDPGDRFGTEIALSEQGTTAIVGAPLGSGRGSAFIYVRSGETWTRQGPALSGLEGTEPCVAAGGHELDICQFGVSVALSAAGNVALVGIPAADGGEGTARIYLRTGTSWVAGPTLHGGGQSATGHFGRSVSLSADGTTALVGAPYSHRGSGVAWVFTRTGESWSSGVQLVGGSEEVGSAYFGRSVALSANGASALITGPYDDKSVGAAWVFSRSGSTWSQQGPKLQASPAAGREQFGSSAALSADGSTAVIGAPKAGGPVGAAYVFTLSQGSWSQQGPALVPAVPNRRSQVGTNVALSGNGDRVLIGGSCKDHSEEAVWEFHREGTTWSEGSVTIGAKAPTPAKLGLGLALAGDGSTALAGAPNAESDTGGVWSLFASDFTAPTVTAVEPDSGPTSGGTQVTIKGAGFLPGATVTIGESADDVEVLSETEMRATTAPGEGVEEVLVADDGGVTGSGPVFTYLPSTPGQSPAASNNAAAGQSGTLASVESKFPLPVLGVSGNLDPVAGHIRVKLPGSHVWVSITTLTQIPFGTIIDARHGKVTITTVGPKGKLQEISFFSGMFKLLQNKKTAEVLAVLVGGDFAVCPRIHGHAVKAEVAASGKHVVRKLWASGHGSYTTKGGYAAGAVVGTKWLTADRCDGTLIYVATDEVNVTNLVTHRHKLVGTHRSYLVAAP